MLLNPQYFSIYFLRTRTSSYITIGYGNSLAVQGLGLWRFHCRGPGSVSGQGTKTPQAARHGQKQKQTIGHDQNENI